jgi:hypothetical protein
VVPEGWNAGASFGQLYHRATSEAGQVRRTTPGWPKRWANFRPLQLYPPRSAANWRLLGQPNTA